MRKILLLLACALASSAAQAQIKCWNEGAKRVCGDAPPAGARVTTLNTPSGPAAPAPASAGKGQLTPAQQEEDFRKRRSDSAKAAEKAAMAERDAAEKRNYCEQARALIRQLESGQRLARTDAKGERYFLDENQIAQELARARQVAQQACT